MLQTSQANVIEPDQDLHGAIARAFREGRQNRVALADFPGPLPSDINEAYQIQDRAIAEWPDKIVGWKVGRILGDMVELHQADRLIGPIFAANLHHATNDTPTSFTSIEDGFCAVEAEYVFELGQDAVTGKTDYDATSALALIANLRIGIEIAGSPLATINALGPKVVVSDFGNNAALILGHAMSDWQGRIEELSASVSIDGQHIGTGSVSSFPGGIVASLVFALNKAASRGLSLKAGCLVSTGAVSGVHEFAQGQSAIADFGLDGKIHCASNPASRSEA